MRLGGLLAWVVTFCSVLVRGKAECFTPNPLLPPHPVSNLEGLWIESPS